MRSILLCVCAVTAACSDSGSNPNNDTVDCTKVTNVDTFVVGLEHHGEVGLLDFQLMSADPAPPARDDNTWVVQINAMASGVVGAPITGASLVVTPYMPAHGHPAGKEVLITPMATAGQYQLAPVNLWMPGVWETTIEATQGTTMDSTVYRFCIPN
jgi:hypothetical protein